MPRFHAAADRPALSIYVHDEVSPGPAPARRRLAGGGSPIRSKRCGADIAGAGRPAGYSRRAGRRRRPENSRAPARPSKSSGPDATAAAEIEIDRRIKSALQAEGVKARSVNAPLLREPWEVVTGAGAPFKVFTRVLAPPSRAGRSAAAPARARAGLSRRPGRRARRRASPIAGSAADADASRTGRAASRETWRPGEQGARQRLDRFVAAALADYPEARDRPDGEHTSRLSPHLRFGEISPRRIVSDDRSARSRRGDGAGVARGEVPVRARLARVLLFAALCRFPISPRAPGTPRFERFPYRDDDEGFRAWTRGRTGYPIVDAGMRELWATGYMHNRVRMVAASFLVKHLLIDWRRGEAMVLGHALRRRPRQQSRELAMGRGFRRRRRALFPHFQSGAAGRKVRPGGKLRPPLGPRTRAPRRRLYSFALAGASGCAGEAGVEISNTYPARIVDHASARERALRQFAAIRGG